MADDNVISLVQKTERERIDAAAFLREWADAIEKEGDTTAVVLILHSDKGEKFLTRVRRCNSDLLHTLGLLQTATADLVKTD